MTVGTSAALSFDRVSKRFKDGTVALTDTTLAVSPGEFVSVVGPSGCGKSTLLRIASGLDRATAGTAEVASAQVGYVFQDATLLPWRSVSANVGLFAELDHLDQAERERRVADAIALDGLRRIGQHLGRAVKNGKDVEAREQMLLGSAMGAIAFQKGLGACHSVAHALTPVAGTHHGLANSLMLPTVIQFNRSAAEERLATAAVALGADPRMSAQERAHACAQIVDDLRAACGLPRRLSQAGVKREMIPRLVEKAMADACHQSNPRACTQVDFERIIEEAF